MRTTLLMSWLVQIAHYLLPIISVTVGFCLGRLAHHLEMKDHAHRYGDAELSAKIDSLQAKLVATRAEAKRLDAEAKAATALIRAALIQSAHVTEILASKPRRNT